MFDLFKSKKDASKQPFQLSNLVEILQDGVCITNVAGEVIYLNRAAFTLLDIEENYDINQINFFEQCVEDPGNIEYLKQQINDQGLVKNFELQLRKLTGNLLDVILTINIIGDFRQQTIGFLFLFKDVTELKKIQQQLLQTQKLESIGLMASGIAHDFNNILAAIIPNAELIKIGSNSDENNFKRAEIIEKSAHRASDIAQRLLTFTRHNEHNNFTSINLNQIVNDSLELLEHSIPEAVEIIQQPGQNLKLVKGDESQMQQIVMNMVINAIDAMSEEGKIYIKTENFSISSHYEIGSLDPGAYVRLSIQDTGSGIPMEIVPKIFDPFFTTKEIGKGTGLGLSVVYGIVKGMNGHIEVDSKMKQGTRFDLYFPVDETATKKANLDENVSLTPQDLRILIVDDEDYVLNILGDILDFLGYKVIKQHNGQDAVAYYKNHHRLIDYVIVDLKMPIMDGRKTSIELSKINPEVKIIFTSGFDDAPVSDDNLPGLIGFIKKPYSINQVANSLQDILVQ